MLSSVKHFIKETQLFNLGDRLIIATSGGKDSMALVHYLHQQSYDIVLAHCNFQLRAAESDIDQQFIQEYCERNKLAFVTVNFDTNEYAKQTKLSTQEAARVLRYEWLEQVRKDHGACCIVTAHHLNDNIETLLFKLSKGTGIKGIRGMKVKNGFVVRPFLETPLSEIWDYIQQEGIQYREDSSNSLSKYDRNKIRHEVMPVLGEINPKIDESFLKHFRRWRDIEAYHQVILEEWKKQLFIAKGSQYFIPIRKLAQLNFNKSLLFDLLSPYHFNAEDIHDMLESLDKKDAKLFESSTHRIIKDRKFLILSSLTQDEASTRFVIEKHKKKVLFGDNHLLRIHLKPIDKLTRISKQSKYAYVDTKALTFPLILRKWEPSDYFYPFGLQKASGKPSKKKIGKYLRDEKLSLHEKEDTWVLCSGEKIVCLLGHRLDDRFKITEKTTEVLSLELLR